MKPRISPKGRIHRLSRNKLGRDFVVGDIHGAYAMLRHGMRMARFNPRVDRLISVGDLIDRGPESLRALEFLGKPWFHGVRGNHDDDFANLPDHRIRQLAAADWNGLGWALNVEPEAIAQLQARLRSLPILMEIETERGVVGIVHGEVPHGMPWSEFTKLIEAGEDECMESALFGRSRIQSGDCSGVEGIGRVFVGHTIQWAGPKRLGNVFAIDTGAVFHELGAGMGSMTMVRIDCPSESLFAPRPSGDGALNGQVWLMDTKGQGSFAPLSAEPSGEQKGAVAALPEEA